MSKPVVLKTITTIFQDLVPLFPNQQVFIGGDECHTTCWAKNDAIQKWCAVNCHCCQLPQLSTDTCSHAIRTCTDTQLISGPSR